MATRLLNFFFQLLAQGTVLSTDKFEKEKRDWLIGIQVEYEKGFENKKNK